MVSFYTGNQFDLMSFKTDPANNFRQNITLPASFFLTHDFESHTDVLMLLDYSEDTSSWSCYICAEDKATEYGISIANDFINYKEEIKSHLNQSNRLFLKAVLKPGSANVFNAIDTFMNLRDEYFECYNSISQNILPAFKAKEIKNKLPIYSRAAKKVHYELENFLEDHPTEPSNKFSISRRIKGIESIQEKVFRKRIPWHNLEDKMIDISGVRIVCPYLSDAYSVCEYLKLCPEIFINTLDDQISRPSKIGYRSIHLEIRTNIFYKGLTYKNIPTELQIRTAFQDAWAQRTHHLTYKKEESEIDKNFLDYMVALSDKLYESDCLIDRINNTSKNT